MAEELRWSTSVQIVSGPTVAGSGAIRTDEYSKTQVVVPADDGTPGSIDVSVDIGNAELFMLKASNYIDADDPTLILTYDINGAGNARDLIAPLLLVGAANVAMLGHEVGAAVTTITFSNPTPDPITVDLVIGGDATP